MAQARAHAVMVVPRALHTGARSPPRIQLQQAPAGAALVNRRKARGYGHLLTVLLHVNAQRASRYGRQGPTSRTFIDVGHGWWDRYMLALFH